jgi:hypothetical protein
MTIKNADDLMRGFIAEIQDGAKKLTINGVDVPVEKFTIDQHSDGNKYGHLTLLSRLDPPVMMDGR